MMVKKIVKILVFRLFLRADGVKLLVGMSARQISVDQPEASGSIFIDIVCLRIGNKM